MTETQDTTAEQLATIYGHLEATAELPVEATASTYLGEATAVAADGVAAIHAGQEAAARKRIQQVRELLVELDETGNADVDSHVDAARRLTGIVMENSQDE